MRPQHLVHALNACTLRPNRYLDQYKIPKPQCRGRTGRPVPLCRPVRPTFGRKGIESSGWRAAPTWTGQECPGSRQIRIFRSPAMSVHLHISVSAGCVLTFSYPTDNRIGVLTRMRRRRFVVESVRDTYKHPIEQWAIDRCPRLRRGQFLLIGYDLDLCKSRKFYLSSARSVKPLFMPIRRLAFYDPCNGATPLKFIGPLWTDSHADNRRVREIIQRYNKKQDTFGSSSRRLFLGLFPYPTDWAAGD